MKDYVNMVPKAKQSKAKPKKQYRILCAEILAHIILGCFFGLLVLSWFGWL
jgi:F0F1-type ATP synthase assembly protein I